VYRLVLDDHAQANGAHIDPSVGRHSPSASSESVGWKLRQFAASARNTNEPVRSVSHGAKASFETGHPILSMMASDGLETCRALSG